MESKRTVSTSGDVCRYLQGRGMTRNELAEMLDVSVSFLSRVARHERNFTLDHLHRLADALDMTLPELLAAATPPESIPARLRRSYRLLLNGLAITEHARTWRSHKPRPAMTV